MFDVITVEEFLKRPYLYDDPIDEIWIAKKGKNKHCYLQLYCGFDIETYTTLSHYAYMYIWQFSIYGKNGNYIIIGRTWEDFVKLIDTLIYDLRLSKERRLIIADCNLGYEHQFMKKHFIKRWTRIFAKEKRKPIYAVIDDCIEFRDVLLITGGSLKTLAKQYTKTQKLSGHLYFNIPRTRYTNLSDKELQYCYNDVAILSEYMEYLFNKYIIPDKYVPLTKTGLLRREVKKAMGSKGNGVKRDIMREIYRCYPKDFNLYTDLMKWCFRGGYTHANIRYVGRVIKKCKSDDITSSYPFTMLASDQFPVSPLKRERVEDFEKLYNEDNHCLFFRVIFTNLRATTDHAIESKSKCISISKNAIIDNGRIRSCTQCEVILTNIDMNMYDLFYQYDSYKIVWLYSSVRGRLPKYLLKPIANAYLWKNKLKRSGKSKTTEYALYKNLLNSGYGMTVTRLVTSEIKMSDLTCEWYDDNTSFDYQKERERAFLLPQWGIFVCCLSRQRILLAIHSLGKDAIYSDTDSIKYVGNHDDYFDMVNKKARESIKKACERLDLDFSHFDDLGSFEREYNNKYFDAKFLGAKRYITRCDGEYETTIAGLPKNALLDYIKKKQIEWEIYRVGKFPTMFDTFTDKMLLDSDVSCKNAHCYNDAPHQHTIDGVNCMELSSVGIYPIDFTMKLSEFYLTLINMEIERNKNYESRIH